MLTAETTRYLGVTWKRIRSGAGHRRTQLIQECQGADTRGFITLVSHYFYTLKVKKEKRKRNAWYMRQYGWISETREVTRRAPPSWVHLKIKCLADNRLWLSGVLTGSGTVVWPGAHQNECGSHLLQPLQAWQWLLVTSKREIHLAQGPCYVSRWAPVA